MLRTRTDLTLPTGEDTALALEASRVLEQRPAADAGLRLQIAGSTGKSTTLDLPAPAAQLLRTILKELGAGNAVTVLPVEAEITTQQAADLLNVSRPFLVGLIEAGTLPARRVGTQRRLRVADVLAYRTQTHAKRKDALRKLAALDQKLGLR